MESLDRSTIWPYDERGEPRDFYYSRYGSPTVAMAEEALGVLLRRVGEDLVGPALRVVLRIEADRQAGREIGPAPGVP